MLKLTFHELIASTKELPEVCVNCSMAYHSEYGLTYCHCVLDQPKGCPLIEVEE